MDELDSKRRKRLEVKRRSKELGLKLIQGDKIDESPKPKDNIPDPDAKFDYAAMLRQLGKPSNEPGTRSDNYEPGI